MGLGNSVRSTFSTFASCVFGLTTAPLSPTYFCMNQPDPHSAPGSAESAGDFRYISEDVIRPSWQLVSRKRPANHAARKLPRYFRWDQTMTELTC
jgi:hypothetical protein